MITSTPVYQAGKTAIFVVWDEGEGPGGVSGERCAASTDPSCRVPAIVIAPSVVPGTRRSTLFSYYLLLKTIEGLLGVPELGQAQTATSMSAAFGL